MDMPSTWLVSGVHCKGRDALLLTIKAISCKIVCPSVAHPHPGELLGRASGSSLADLPMP